MKPKTTEEKKINIYSISHALALFVINKHPELSWNTLFKKMYEDKNFRKETMDYLDERFIAKVLVDLPVNYPTPKGLMKEDL